jgi:hypothetical protein
VLDLRTIRTIADGFPESPLETPSRRGVTERLSASSASSAMQIPQEAGRVINPGHRPHPGPRGCAAGVANSRSGKRVKHPPRAGRGAARRRFDALSAAVSA